MISVRTPVPLAPLMKMPFDLVALVDAGDVQVRPGRVLDELLQEEGGRDGACLAAADVLDVGDLAVQLLAVLLEERQLPDPLAGGLRRRR